MTAITVAATGAPAVRPVIHLASVEAWRLIRHPAFLAGLAISGVAQVTVSLSEGPSSESWAGQLYYVWTTGWVWLWVGTMIAAACIAGRNRWLAEPDLFPGTPITTSGRLAATALAVAGPVVVAMIAVVGSNALAGRDGGFDLGDAPYTAPTMPPLVQSVQVVALVALAGLVGISVTRVRHARLVALVAITAATWVGVFAIWMFGIRPVRTLHPFMYPAYEAKAADGAATDWVAGNPPLLMPNAEVSWREVRFDTAAMWWHLGYLAGLMVLVLALATRATEDSPRWRPLLAVALVLTVGCGVVQTLLAGTPA